MSAPTLYSVFIALIKSMCIVTFTAAVNETGDLKCGTFSLSRTVRVRIPCRAGRLYSKAYIKKRVYQTYTAECIKLH